MGSRSNLVLLMLRCKRSCQHSMFKFIYIFQIILMIDRLSKKVYVSDGLMYSMALPTVKAV